MEDQYDYLEFRGVKIAASIKSGSNDVHDGYQGENILFYVEKGQLNIRYQNKLFIVGSGECCLVRKFAEVEYFKTWSEEEEFAVVSVMALQDTFINDALDELNLSKPKKQIDSPVLCLQKNIVLQGLYHSLGLYLSQNESPDKSLMYLKTKEALLGILKANPDYLAFFYEFSKPVKAELGEFMNRHALLNIPLDKLASLSGRSLSTFNRDFRKYFQTSPHKWMLKQRLNKAKELLSFERAKASQIYLDLGFKDLGHFSRAFKKEFGMSPSKV